MSRPGGPAERPGRAGETCEGRSDLRRYLMRANAPASADSRGPEDDAIFGRLLVGIDETPESLIAAAQAGALRAPDGQLVLLAVVERYLATHAGLAAADAEDRLTAGTSADLARARELVD